MLPEGHEFMTNSEIAQSQGVCVKTVQRWKKQLNIKNNNTWGQNHGTRPFNFVRYGLKFQRIHDRKIWDNKFWLNYIYNEVKLGSGTIAYIINRSTTYTKLRLRHYGIELREKKASVASKNPCCTRQWLEENYILEQKTLTQCADLAGVNRYTIINWLIKYGFEIRDRHEALVWSSKTRHSQNTIPTNTAQVS